VGFLAFIDGQDKLIGVITDGDLRRGILNKDLSVQSVVNHNPLYMKADETKESIIAKLKSVHRRHMPLVNIEGVLESVFSLDDIEFISKKNVVVIMAGGLGTRLGDLTKDTPKPMLVVGDRPMLQHLVEQFRDQGFYKFVFCLNYKKEVITEYFKDGSRFGVNIEHVVENKKLGTAGALSLIDESSIEEPFFVINADVMAVIDFNKALDLHLDRQSVATMCVRNHELKVSYGVINSNERGEVLSLQEKPTMSFDVNAGIYVLNSEVLKLIPVNQFYDMPTLFENLISLEKKASVYRLDDYWVDIGKVEDFKKANSDFQI